ncbi:MAG: hypothetical protein RMJ28_05545 [Nitrososphaerota archaeon]|nr:hypothetical protein [Candidatus Calditenuaceae archaeon]MDW8073677.1 hypothetical protein [Nitrososphaerota archaeon]
MIERRIMVDWRDRFRAACEEMRGEGETRRTLADGAKIIWCPDEKCYRCGNIGVFYGTDFFCKEKNQSEGVFYYGEYCPACERVILDSWFLPIERAELAVLKKLIIEDPLFRARVELEKRGKCPVCGSDTYTYHREVGGVDYVDEYLIVCINPSCIWSGNYAVYWEPGPYV